MKARELAQLLLANPTLPVRVETPDTIAIVTGVEVDSFAPSEGQVLVILLAEDE